jgi:hypothetical protein
MSIWAEQYSISFHKAKENQKETVIYSYLKIENNLTDKNIDSVKKHIEKLFLDDLSLIEEKIWKTAEIDQLKNRFHDVYLLKKQLKDKLYQDIFVENGVYKNTEFAYGVFSSSQADLNIGYNLDFFLEDFLLKNLSMIFANTGTYFKQIAKLDSVRANTQRIYTYSSQGTSFNDLLLSILKGDLNKGFNSEIFLNKWLNKFGIKGKLEVSNSQPGVGITITIGGRPLADLGYGLTQLLPILLEIILVGSKNDNLYEFYYTHPNSGNNFSSTLIIEEPETNLHPKFQSLLADLFVDASRKYRIQFIIETHSEYLIRKLQYLTGKGDLKSADTSLYYFYHPAEIPEREKQVKKIEIQEDGSLSSDFGTGFYDEALNWKFELLKLKNKN